MSSQISRSHAVGYALGGFTVWALSDGCMKLAGQSGLPVYQILAVSSVASMLVIAAHALKDHALAALCPKHARFALLRSLLLLVFSFLNIFAFTHLPLTTVYIFGFLSPLIITVLATLIMREHPPWQQMLAIAIGFVGVVIAVKPWVWRGTESSAMAYAALIVGVFFYSVCMFMTRFLGKSESIESLALWPQVLRTAVGAILCLVWHFDAMNMKQWLYVIGLGIGNGAGWLLLGMAYKHAPAATVAPFHYSQIITGAFLGYLIWHDVPTLSLIVGAIIIIASGVYIARGGGIAKETEAVPS